MKEVLSFTMQQLAVDSIAHAASMAGEAVRATAATYERPSVVYRPRLSIDGNMWCALYGDNLQDGVAGFGRSPAEAMLEFDKAWWATLPAKPLQSEFAAVLSKRKERPNAA